MYMQSLKIALVGHKIALTTRNILTFNLQYTICSF